MQNQDQDRMDQLATQVRRLRWMNYGMAAVIAAGVISACTGSVPSVLRVERLEIIADDGKTALALGSNSAGGTLTTFNGKGQELVALSATPGGAGVLSTYNGEGQMLVVLGATPDGEGVITTLNREGEFTSTLP